jgi:hypothetical protein
VSKKVEKQEDDIYERDRQGIVGEKPEVRNRPGHHMGRRGEYGGGGNGYHLHENGSYELCGSDQNSFLSIDTDIAAVHDLLDNINRYAQKELKRLHEQRFRWFARICNGVYRESDVGTASYNPSTGLLSFKEIAAPPSNKGLEERIDLDRAGAGTPLAQQNTEQGGQPK